MARYWYYFCYRNLVKPIAVQSKEKEDRYVDTYKVIQITVLCCSVYKLLYEDFIFFICINGGGVEDGGDGTQIQCFQLMKVSFPVCYILRIVL